MNPTGGNPTGTVLTDSRKRQIYELAETYNFLILEDDPYSFVHFLDKPPTTFLELDTKGRVIRLDSISKVISPGLRLGVVTAHKEIIKKLTVHMETTSIHPSSLSQVIQTCVILVLILIIVISFYFIDNCSSRCYCTNY